MLVGTIGELYIADTGNNRVRRVALDGTIRTIAGSGMEAASGDSGPAIAASLDAPSGLALRPDGALLIADRLNSLIRVVTGDGLIASLPHTTAPVRRSSGVSVDPNGNVYLADTGHYQVRTITANGSGVLLGSSEQGALNLTASAGQTPMGAPFAVAADATGGIAVTDRDHHQVQHLALPQLHFADTVVGQQSLSKSIDLRNAGAAPLNVSDVRMPSGFTPAPGSTCASAPFVLPAAAHCSLAIAFAPNAAGAQGGTLQLTVDGGLPQQALLNGSAVPAGSTAPSSVMLQSSGSVSYVGVPVTLSAKVVTGSTFIPTGTLQLLDAANPIGSAALGSDGTAQFTIASLTPGQHTLLAQYSGDRNYAASTSVSLQQTVALAPDFTLTAGSPRVAMKAGDTSNMPITLQPMNGTLNHTVVLAVDGLPAGATITTTPSPLQLGSDAITVTLTLKTPASTALRRTAYLSAAALLLCFGLRQRSGISLGRMCVMFLLFALLGTAGCSGGYLSGTSTSAQSVGKTYPITVTATTTGVTGSPLVHTATFTLVVN